MDADVHHDYDKIAQRLHHCVSVVARRVAVNASSRVAGWVRAIDRLARTNKRDVLEALVESYQAGVLDHPFRDCFTALTESRTFIEVVEQLAEHLTDQELRELVKGHPDPAKDGPSARARNKEFEWYVAALFRRAGLSVAIAEPDVLINFRGHIRSIAAKRISSRKQLNSNIKSAAAQIHRSAYRGYIFLEVTKHINPDMHFAEHWRDDGKTVQTRMTGLAKNPYVTTPRGPHVGAVFIRSAFPMISPNFRYGTSERWQAVGLELAQRDENVLLLHFRLSGLRGV